MKKFQNFPFLFLAIIIIWFNIRYRLLKYNKVYQN